MTASGFLSDLGLWASWALIGAVTVRMAAFVRRPRP